MQCLTNLHVPLYQLNATLKIKISRKKLGGLLGFKKINVPSETGAKSVINGIVHTVLLETVNV